jgi:hypothetical protein
VVICGDDAVPVFDRLRYGRPPQSDAALFAFDLLELGAKTCATPPGTSCAPSSLLAGPRSALL